jgi:hypothetical protein
MKDIRLIRYGGPSNYNKNRQQSRIHNLTQAVQTPEAPLN